MQDAIKNTRGSAFKLGCLFGALVFVAGCGGVSSVNPGPALPTDSAALTGKLLGGQYPVQGAAIQLYVTGSTGYGTGAQALLSPAVLTDRNGYFFIPPSAYTCPSGNALTYILATGGDPGLGSNNPSIALMAALGTCGSLNSIPFVNVNEVTTIAAVWALTPFLGPGAQVGTSPTNAQGLVNAFANVNNLVDITRGAAPGTAAPTGAAIPVAKIYTLANIIAACVNSSGSTACNALFALATPPGGTAPANTLDAALDIARNPSNNAAALFAIPAPTAPFQPGLSIAPADWTIGVTFSGGGLNHPASIAVDASGNVWSANFCGSNNPCSSVTELSSSGQPVSPTTGFTDGQLWENYGLAIDFHGNVWVTNQQTTSVNSRFGSLSVLNSSGQIISPAGGYFGGGVYFPVAAATDTDGSVWSANLGNSTVSLLANNGSALSASGGWGAGSGLAGPAAVAIDASHNAWFANQYASSGSVTSVSHDGSRINTIASGGFQPSGVATDLIGISTNTSKGHVWVTNFGSSTVSELELNNNGTVTVVSTGYTGGGISSPNGIAVDGAGNVWITNYHGNTISELQGANGANPGHALSSASGFGLDANLSQPYGMALDGSGNVWVSNFGSSTITQFLGAATPVKTPLIGPTQLP